MKTRLEKYQTLVFQGGANILEHYEQLRVQ